MPVRLSRWAENLRRLALGRPPWSAEREFAYYRVEPAEVQEHRRRQGAFAREGYIAGLRIARALDLLDTEALRGRAVLDLGAGECLLSAALARLGAREVWATDAVPKQIWAAAAHHQGAPGLRFLVADARDLPLPDGAFDLVVANLLLHHVEPLQPLLREALRLLAPGGELRAFEPNPLLGALAHEATSENEAPIGPRRVREELQQAGFLDAATSYFWSRLETGGLGPLSPGFRVRARKPGAARPPGGAPILPTRTLAPMALANLLMDTGCAFAQLARAQEQAILAALGAPAGPPPGRTASGR